MKLLELFEARSAWEDQADEKEELIAKLKSLGISGPGVSVFLTSDANSPAVRLTKNKADKFQALAHAKPVQGEGRAGGQGSHYRWSTYAGELAGLGSFRFHLDHPSGHMTLFPLKKPVVEAKKAVVAKKPAVPPGKPPAVRSAWEDQKDVKERGKLDPKKWPVLKRVWDAYGHDVPFEKLDGIKSQRGCYCVVRWTEPDGKVGIADLARGGTDQDWEVQNDGFDEITEADWRKLKIVPECDWFEIKGHPEFDRGDD